MMSPSVDWPAAAVLVIALVVAALAAWWGTSLVRRYAISQSLVDIPNDRSSHSTPTPRGGGLAIVAVVFAGVALQTVIGGLDRDVGIGVLGGGGLIALVGWIDDRSDLRARWRAMAQFAAAIWFVSWVGAPQSLWLGTWSLPLSVAAPVLAVVSLVWLINLFNFMDGIDGIAGGEAVSVGAAGGVLLLASGASGLASTAFLVAAASMGFLVWNWAPARIFMGDVGSGFLGFMLGALAIAADRSGAVPLLVWLLLMGVFVFDATVTLLRRLRRERVYEAHRRHAYQRAVAAGLSHRTVALGVLGLNGALVILAAVAWTWSAAAPLAVLAAAALLTSAYVLVERHRPMWVDSGGGDAGPVRSSLPRRPEL
jgi:Fuc2NAc and GlcNAc transferase